MKFVSWCLPCWVGTAFHQCGLGLTPGLGIILFGLSLFALYSGYSSCEHIITNFNPFLPCLSLCPSVCWTKPCWVRVAPFCLKVSITQCATEVGHIMAQLKELKRVKFSLLARSSTSTHVSFTSDWTCKDTTYTIYFLATMMSVSVFPYRISSISHNLKFTYTHWIIGHCTDFGNMRLSQGYPMSLYSISFPIYTETQADPIYRDFAFLG